MLSAIFSIFKKRKKVVDLIMIIITIVSESDYQY